MDHFLPSSSSNANSVQELSMDFNNNLSHFSTNPTQHHHHHHSLPPYSNVACPVEQMSTAMNHQLLHSSRAFPQIFVTENGSGLRQERGMKKMARINRKNAIIRSRNNPNPNSYSKRHVMMNMKKNVKVTVKEDLFRYSTFDRKKLRILLVKHLKKSDVGSLGRIVLPKREAEANLAKLSDKEGIILEMRHAHSMQSWTFKYKYWSNNKSRMYVLENKGEFVTKNRVETGDSLTIYEDQSKNLVSFPLKILLLFD